MGDPDILVAVTLYGHGKDYVLPKFEEMLDECVAPRATVRFYGDRPPINPHWPWRRMPSAGGNQWAEDMLIESREQAFADARNEEYDVLVLHGVDALWESRHDFYDVAAAAYVFQTIRAPLITARADAQQLILRRFDRGPNGEVLETQKDLHPDEVMGMVNVGGFPGADNIAIPRVAFDVPFRDGHDPWYARVAQGRPNLCVEEEWCRRALEAGHEIWCDSTIRIQHVHEDRIARRWCGVTTPLDDFKYREGVLQIRGEA